MERSCEVIQHLVNRHIFRVFYLHLDYHQLYGLHRTTAP